MSYNKVRVTICGKEYVLKTTEDPAYLKSIAKQLNDKIQATMDEDDTITLTTAAILVGLSILDDKFKTNSDIDNIRTQITSYVEEAADARLKAEKLENELENTKRELQRLKTDNELLKLKGTL